MLCLLLFLAVSFLWFQEIKRYQGLVGMTYSADFFAKEQLGRFWEQTQGQEKYRGIRDMALYKKLEEQTVENEELNRSIQTTVILAAGNMELIFLSDFLQGTYVSPLDETGCVISRTLSQEIFGNQKGMGETLRYGEKSYIVRGILDCKEKVLMIRGDSTQKYSGIRISYEGMGADGAVGLLQGILPEEEGIRMEGDLYAGLAGICFSIPVILLFLIGICILHKRLCQKQKIWWVSFGCLLAAVGGSVLILQANVSFSADYLPAAWSDFSFWGELWEEKWGDMRQLFFGGRV